MSETTKVKIDRAVGENLIKISVSRTFGQGEQLNAEVDVPLDQAAAATNKMYETVITPRALSYIKEVQAYQLEQDIMAYTAEERDRLLANTDVIDTKVKERINKNKKEGRYDG